ncbi:MAG TPA: alkaline phosphatase family protein [Acidimicrobiales bacterium]|nr:alkaline phosphatase family protein [Acidimicrobiales bacterium]
MERGRQINDLNSHTRRDFLIGGLAGTAALGLAACGRSTVRSAASIAPAGSDLGAVDHVVMLMQENRSFDNYFGTYKGVIGFNDHPATGPGVFAQSWPGGTSSGGKLLPFHLDTSTQNAACTSDLSHAWNAQHLSWNNGLMDSFVVTHTSAQFDGPSQGILTMGYYTREDLGFYYSLADEFTLCDRYHCSAMGPTHPNRLMWISGTLDPDGLNGGPVLETNEASTAKFSVSWDTMPEHLAAKGVSWKVYNPPGAEYQPDSPQAMIFSDNPLLYFKQYQDPTTEIHQRAFSSIYPDDFAKDVAAGTLPQVSWIIPPIGYDEHPPAPSVLGEWFSQQVISTLISNPKVWSKTVLFIMHDENDGFFDHVAPPVAPKGTPGEYVSVDPLPPQANGIAGPIGLGFRVPMLVVSPFSRGGYICSEVFDHTSQLRFIETRFGVGVPNLSSWRRGVTGDLTSTLHMGYSDSSVPRLAAASKTDPVIARECQTAQLAEINVPMPQYPVPANQVMPVQEPGKARRVST